MVPADDVSDTGGAASPDLIMAAVLEATPDGIVAVGGDGRILLHNRRFQELWGLDPASLHRRSWDMVIRDLGTRLADPADVRHITGTAFAAPMAAGGVPHDLELRDGRVFRWRDTALHSIKAGGEGRLWSFRDATRERAAEAAMRLSVERFRDYAGTTSDWFWETDRNLRFCFLSDRFEEATGEKPTRVLGKSRFEAGGNTPDDPAWRAHLDDLVHHRRFRNFTYVHRRTDGALRVFRMSGTPFLDAQGLFAGYRGVGADITDTVETGRALAESERRFRDLVEGSVQGICIHRDFKPLFVNGAYARMMGFDSVDEVLAQPSILQSIAPESRDRAIEQLHRLRTGEAASGVQRVRNIRKNGVEIWLDLTDRMIDWQGEPAVQVALQDVTRQVLVERDLDRRNAEFLALIRDLASVRGAV